MNNTKRITICGNCKSRIDPECYVQFGLKYPHCTDCGVDICIHLGFNWGGKSFAEANVKLCRRCRDKRVKLAGLQRAALMVNFPVDLSEPTESPTIFPNEY